MLQEVQQIFDLTDKVAIVTGGHSGLGKSIAEGLAGAGANIIIAARRFELCQQVAAEISRTAGVKCLPIKCDVAKKEEVNNLVELTIKEFGKVDVLVNNAGVEGSQKPIFEMADEDWDITINTNLKGTFLCSKAAAREMAKHKEGKIINIASIMAIIASRNLADYATSKAGIVQLTRAMALEMVKYNIQVNVICPGYFLTPFNEGFFSSQLGKQIVERNIPMRRLGKVDELKGIAIYLASPASSFTTGAAIVIDGGQTLW